MRPSTFVRLVIILVAIRFMQSELTKIRNIMIQNLEEDTKYDPFLEQGGLNDKLLFYNRVPKSGSGTLKKILTKLSRTNGFTFESSTEFERRHRTEGEQVPKNHLKI